MSALCAAMRKLVQICFGVIKHQQPYHVQTKFLWLEHGAERWYLRSCHCVTSLQVRCWLRNTTSND